MKSIARMRSAAARLRIMLAIMVTAMLVGVGSAAPATAHTALQSASPGEDSTVRPPTQIVLTYNEPVQFTRVLVTDAAGRQYQSGKPVNVDNTVTENLSATPPNGRYTVAWRVVAPDGHPVEGTYQFTVAGSSAAEPTAAPAAPAAPGRPAATSSGTSPWWIVVIVLLIAAAAVGGIVLLRQSATDAGGDADIEAGAGRQER
ncbi:MAG TPA: copper resistance CopC family protein [Streptosporangiaceae bacterium]|jgi:methionine-rich copper-binding protein CopC|nr:copper resistance CopC family protein [Streptosporangiaceae bacterium]